MNLGIDVSQIVYEGTGVGRFVSGLVGSVLQFDRTNRWTFFFSSLRQRLKPQIRETIKKNGHQLFEYRLPPSALSFLWNTLHRMKVEKLVGKLDWFLTSDWTEPPSCLKKATVIHDLAYLRYPETVHPTILKTQRQRMEWIKKESSVVFADSETTKSDAVHLCGLDEKKIFINYPGVQFPKSSETLVNHVKTRYRLERPFILTVGKIEPRKNLKRLIHAFDKMNNSKIDLVIVGHQGWDTEISKRYYQSENVKFLSYIPDDELSALYASCLFFIYPSLYEGFGYPVIEAMGCGAAVATSDTSSLSEIGRSHALLFDPKSTEELELSMRKLVIDGALRNNLKKQGIIRSRDFIWRDYYRKMIDVLTEH